MENGEETYLSAREERNNSDGEAGRHRRVTMRYRGMGGCARWRMMYIDFEGKNAVRLVVDLIDES